MYLSSPEGTTYPSHSAILTRRRLKAFLPVCLALLLLTFFVTAFYAGDDQDGGLLARARRIYLTSHDDNVDTQAALSSPPEDVAELERHKQAGPPSVHLSGHSHASFHQPASVEEKLKEAATKLDQDLDFPDSSKDDDIEDLPDYDTDSLPDELLDYDTDYGAGPPGMDYLDYNRNPQSPTLVEPGDDENDYVTTIPDRGDYRELFSLTTKDRRYIPVFFEGAGVTNPSVIPHPSKHELWVILADRVTAWDDNVVSKQVVCEAGLLDGVFICTEPFYNLTMSSYVQGACEGELAYMNDRSGAQGVRLFYGREEPFVMYGSQSQHTCVSMWLQDARTVLETFHLQKPLARFFSHATEVQRPPPYKVLETEFVLFWDSEGKTYVQHELWPKRTIAKLDIDGSVGEDLAPAAAATDRVCMARYMPRLAPTESIEQASNSLAITMCERLDPGCRPSDKNTFIMQIVHHRSDYDSHTVYEPYLFLFQQTAPFALHAISQRPFWIHGREALTNQTRSPQYVGIEEDIPSGHTERFAIPSISWKNHIQRYHGYSDDVLMLGIGIEDGRGGVMDVKAKDLLSDLALCSMS